MSAATETSSAREAQPGPAERGPRRYALHGVIAALIVLTLVSYRHITRNGFVFDDGFYLAGNPQVQGGISLDSAKWAFTTFYGANWQPVTWLSSMLDYTLFGSNPLGHHATNLALHLAGTVMLLLVLRRMTGSLWRSAFVAAVFALHPLHVESVAWASERKDVLSAFFMLLAVRAYADYAEQPNVRRYLAVAAAFALGLMAKPMLVTLPILLLLLDWWPLARLAPSRGGEGRPWKASPTARGSSSRGGLQRPPGTDGIGGPPGRPWKASPTAWFGRPLKVAPTGLIVEKIPLFALSLASCVVTFIAQREGGAVIQLVKFPLGLRIANAATSCAGYIWKALWPAGLAAYYPYPREGVPAASLAIALAALAAVSLLALRLGRTRRYLAFGWLWYVVTLVPVIGIVQVGEQAMADRYTYIPLIGLAIMAAWGISDLLQRARPIALGLAALVVLAMVPATSAQVRHWESDYTLFRRAASVTRGSALIFSNYGVALADREEYDRAIEQYRKAIEADPYYVQSYLNMGNAFRDSGRPEEALEHYARALEVNPDYSDAARAAAQVHGDLGLALAQEGKTAGAISHLEQAVELDPENMAARGSLAIAYFTAGRYPEAWEQAEMVESGGVSLPPGFMQALSAKMK